MMACVTMRNVQLALDFTGEACGGRRNPSLGATDLWETTRPLVSTNFPIFMIYRCESELAKSATRMALHVTAKRGSTVEWGLILGAAAGLIAPASTRSVTFNNTAPRTDVHGKILTAHDGTIQRFPADPSGKFYYHAMGYPALPEPGKINGCSRTIYAHNNSIAVYSSPDLSSGSWQLEETVYPSATSGFPECTYFRSQAAYNPATKTYVLWVNVAGCAPSACDALPNKTCLAYAVGTAKSPQGPFKFAGTTEPTAQSLGNRTGGKGDFALYVDTDGSGYILLTHLVAGAGHRDMFIYKLTSDFLGLDSAVSECPCVAFLRVVLARGVARTSLSCCY